MVGAEVQKKAASEALQKKKDDLIEALVETAPEEVAKRALAQRHSESDPVLTTSNALAKSRLSRRRGHSGRLGVRGREGEEEDEVRQSGEQSCERRPRSVMCTAGAAAATAESRQERSPAKKKSVLQNGKAFGRGQAHVGAEGREGPRQRKGGGKGEDGWTNKPGAGGGRGNAGQFQ